MKKTSQKKHVHNSKEVLKYWNQKEVKSMYDKNLLNLEIQLIKSRLSRKSKILDVGCGEGESTLEYSKIAGVKIHAADFSDTRLKKASRRLGGRKNVILKKVDFLGNYSLNKNYDTIISQRFLINLMAWKLQKKVLLDLKSMLKKRGRLILLEGSLEGVNSLNKFRRALEMKPIPVKWHNLFFNDKQLTAFMKKNQMKLVEEDGLGEYFILTRGVRPYFDRKLNWDSKFNKMAAKVNMKHLLGSTSCNRLKLWIFEKVQ